MWLCDYRGHGDVVTLLSGDVVLLSCGDVVILSCGDVIIVDLVISL